MNQVRSTHPSFELVRKVCRALDDKKAEDLRVLDVSAQSSLTDFLILATGTSDPHLRALRIELERVLDGAKARIVGVETEQGSGWVVVDAFELMVHLFTRERRDHYRLETLWKDAVELSLPRVLADAPVPQVKPTKKPAKAKVKAPARKVATLEKKSPVKKATVKKAPTKKVAAAKPAAKKAASRAKAKKAGKGPLSSEEASGLS